MSYNHNKYLISNVVKQHHIPLKDNAAFPSFNSEKEMTINPVSLVIFAPSPLTFIL